jgi:hypothetical protein
MTKSGIAGVTLALFAAAALAGCNNPAPANNSASNEAAAPTNAPAPSNAAPSNAAPSNGATNASGDQGNPQP